MQQNIRSIEKKPETNNLYISQLIQFLDRKKINSQLFLPGNKIELTIESKFELHANWLYQNMMRKDLYTHGSLHANRVSFLATVFINFFRMLGYRPAMMFPSEWINPLQITLFCHDIGREGDGEDVWDLDSALLLYYYLTCVLNYEPKKAALFAEAIANKDWNYSKLYHKLKKRENGLVEWDAETSSFPHKPFLPMIVHECDCFDIARVHRFSILYSDAYNLYGTDRNPLGKFMLSRILHELKSIMTVQGDYHSRKRPDLHRSFNSKDAYSKVLSCIIKNEIKQENKYEIQSDRIEIDIRDCYKVLTLLYANDQLLDGSHLQKAHTYLLALYQGELSLQPSEKMYLTSEGEKICKAYSQTGLLARNVALPSFLTKSDDIEKQQESLADKDARKAVRRFTHRTRTKKMNGNAKYGNPNRSCIFLHETTNSELFAGQAYLSFIDFNLFKDAQVEDLGSGFQKKRKYTPPMSNPEEKKATLERLKEREQLGGLGRERLNYHEVISDLVEFVGVLWSKDPILHNSLLYRNHYPIHPLVPLLQAIVLQKSYEKEAKVKLPLFEYSFHGYLKEEKPLSDNDILDIWDKVCLSYLQKKFDLGRYFVFLKNVEQIKIACVYGDHPGRSDIPHQAPRSADFCYSPDLQVKISKIIEKHVKVFYDKIMDACHRQLKTENLSVRSLYFLLNLNKDGDILFFEKLKGKFYFIKGNFHFYKQIIKLAKRHLSIFEFIIQNFSDLRGQIDLKIFNDSIQNLLAYYQDFTEEEIKIIEVHRKSLTPYHYPQLTLPYLKELSSILQSAERNVEDILRAYQKGLDLLSGHKLETNIPFKNALQSQIYHYQEIADKEIRGELVSRILEAIIYFSHDIDDLIKQSFLEEKQKTPLDYKAPQEDSKSNCYIGLLMKSRDAHYLVQNIFQFLGSDEKLSLKLLIKTQNQTVAETKSQTLWSTPVTASNTKASLFQAGSNTTNFQALDWEETAPPPKYMSCLIL